MGIVKRVAKPVTHKGKKVLLNKEPKYVEDAKETLFMRGKNTTDTVTRILKDLYSLKKPNAVMLGKKNDILPFENITPVEKFCHKYNTSLFVFGNNNKKRPNNLILGRTFQHQLLDMIELGVINYKGIAEFLCDKIPVGLKPCLIFAGESFNTTPEMARLKSLLVDMFHREKADAVRLQGLQHVLMFTAADEKIFMRSYRILLKKSSGETPRIELDEIGPCIDFKIRRSKLASDDLLKTTCKKPKELQAKKVKNISKDVFGSTHARIHVSKQNISTMQVRKVKALRKSKKTNKVDSDTAQSVSQAISV